MGVIEGIGSMLHSWLKLSRPVTTRAFPDSSPSAAATLKRGSWSSGPASGDVDPFAHDPVGVPGRNSSPSMHRPGRNRTSGPPSAHPERDLYDESPGHVGQRTPPGRVRRRASKPLGSGFKRSAPGPTKLVCLEPNRLSWSLRTRKEGTPNYHRTGATNGPTEALNLIIDKSRRLGYHLCN